MNVLLLTRTACPICGYHNDGVLSGTATPRMHTLSIKVIFGLDMPWRCRECNRRLGVDNPDRAVLDPKSASKVERWRTRQRGRRATRRRVA